MPTKKTQVELEEMDLACWEILWRLMPGGVVVMPAALTGFVGRALLHTGDLPAEEHLLLDKWLHIAERAAVLLVPVWGRSPGHWTLLVVDKGVPVVSKPDTLPTDSPVAGLTGCASCKNCATGCASCMYWKASRKDRRLSDEWALLQPELQQPVHAPPPAEWKVRYYDSLYELHADCSLLAANLLQLLVPRSHDDSLPLRQHHKRQEDCECGWLVLHYVEEECKRRLGQPCWSACFKPAFRLERMLAMRTRMLLAKALREEKAKEQAAKAAGRKRKLQLKEGSRH